MNSELEIIIPATIFGDSFVHTIDSLLAQTDKQFSVLLADDFAQTFKNHFVLAQKRLATANIPVRRVQPPGELKRIEHLNWAHTQSSAAWFKLLLPGEELKPKYIERLTQRIRERPSAQIIRCDLELRAEWGIETLSAPFDLDSITATEVTDYFPAQTDWLSYSANFACTRAAWLALGGYSPYVPGSTALNLSAMLALHYGLENIRETLVSIECPANEKRVERFSRAWELWLILLQARNYCLAAKLPWSTRCLFWKSLTISLRSR